MELERPRNKTGKDNKGIYEGYKIYLVINMKSQCREKD